MPGCYPAISALELQQRHRSTTEGSESEQAEERDEHNEAKVAMDVISATKNDFHSLVLPVKMICLNC
jgi:hypothetical protein